MSPLKLASAGGAAILMLIGIGLHPPAGGSGNRVPPLAASSENETAVPSLPATEDSDRYGATPSDDASTSGDPPSRGPSTSRSAARNGGTGGNGNGAQDEADQDEADQDENAGSGQVDGGGDSADGGSASNDGGESDGGGESDDSGPATVSCPSVAAQLPAVPAGAAGEVNQNLALLKEQIADADARLAELAANPVDDPNFVENTILGPLRNNRIATIDRIAIAIGRYTTRPTGLEQLAPCALDD